MYNRNIPGHCPGHDSLTTGLLNNLVYVQKCVFLYTLRESGHPVSSAPSSAFVQTFNARVSLEGAEHREVMMREYSGDSCKMRDEPECESGSGGGCWLSVQ